VGREDDVDDVLRLAAAHRRDRVDDRDRSLERHRIVDSHLLEQLAPERVDERLARVDAAAWQEPVLASRLLVAAEQDEVLPTQERGDTDAGFDVHQCLPEEPKPPSPRSLSGSASTSRRAAPGTATTTSWA